MTTVIGYIDKKTGISYLASDTRCSIGNDIVNLDEPKVFHIEKEKQLMLGVAGRLDGLNKLRNSKELLNELVLLNSEGLPVEPDAEPVRAKVKDIDKDWILTHFSENLKFEFGQASDPDEFKEVGYGSKALAIFNGKLFFTDGFGTMLFTADNFHSIGSGSVYALGCLFALKNSKMSVEKKLKKAFETAINFDSGTGGKFYVISSDNLEVREL